MKRMKKWLALALAAVLLVPTKYGIDDGGSVEYRAVLYSVTRYHVLRMDGTGYDEGWRVEALGVELFDSLYGGS